MEITPKQEAVNLIKQHRKILIVHSRPDGDAVGSALALYLTLKKMGKEPVIVCGETMPDYVKFLPAFEEVKTDLTTLQDFVIALDCGQVQPKKLSHRYENGKLEIFITPKNGKFTSDLVTFSEGAADFDLVITLDTADPQLTGSFYEQYPQLLRDLPVINIDHHTSNLFFGTVNFVDVTASSTAEILVGLIEALGQDTPLMDAQVATCLLAGVLFDTGSFQHANTTPKSLTIGAQLVAAGADQQQIVKQLFKTYSLSTLHLWGRALERVRFDQELKFVWSYLKLDDFESTHTSSSSSLVDKLMTGVPEAEIVVLLSEKEPGEVCGSVRTVKGIDASAIAKTLGGGGMAGAAGFKLIGTNINDALDLVFDKVKAFRTSASESPIDDKLVNPEEVGLQ